jgi:hypothetical protein
MKYTTAAKKKGKDIKSGNGMDDRIPGAIC